MVWTNPKLDWITNPHRPMAEDLNRIEGNIGFLKTDIETKKGLIVDALVSLGFAVNMGTPYADLATIISGILQASGNANPEDVVIGKTFSKTGQVGLTGTAKRRANGTGYLTQVNVASAKLTVTGLPFMPSKIYLKGSVRARYTDSTYPEGNAQNHTTYLYSVFENVMTPLSSGGHQYTIMPQLPNYTTGYAEIRMACDISIQSNGFTMTLTQTQPDNKGLDQYGEQTWLAIE